MPLQRKIFRVFISSTFSDMREERNLLQTRVFPELEKFCEDKGAKFQGVDLRWGVSEESQLDQKTMEICLNEIARCQRISPKPNFLILLGDRYGWQPVPAKIPMAEMNALLGFALESEKKLLNEWYWLDENAIPAEYVLQPRKKEYKDYANYEPVEDKLRTILRRTAGMALFRGDKQIKYFTSATHQEIMLGLFNPEFGAANPEKHVFAYARNIRGLPRDANGKDYIDLSGAGQDPYCSKMLQELRKTLKARLKGNYHEYNAQWLSSMSKMDSPESFSEKIISGLKSVIKKQIREVMEPDELQEEIRQHVEFMERLTEHFCGREKTLAGIKEYVSSDRNSKILSIIGASGSGKSSLMAQAIKETGQENSNAIIAARFIGVTSRSVSILSMLQSVCSQITAGFGTTVREIAGDNSPGEIHSLTMVFEKCMRLSTQDRPVILFLDALDQLSDADNAKMLYWLPKELPAHAKIVVSVLPELETNLSETETIYLPSMPVLEAESILAKWLGALKPTPRKLTPLQKREILYKFSLTGLPVFLKLAFEQVKSWHSYDTGVSLQTDVKSILNDFFDILEKTHTRNLVSTVIGYLLSGKYPGLTETEILDMLVFDRDFWVKFLDVSHRAHLQDIKLANKIPIIVWSRLFLDLEPYLTERDADGELLITFFHKQFTGFARERYVEKTGAGKRFHRLLSQYYGQKLLFFGEAGMERPDVRKVIEQPYQQTMAEMWDEAAETLTDLRFIEAKVRTGMVHPLLEDYEFIFLNLPESKKEREKELDREKSIEEWIQKIIDYSNKWNDEKEKYRKNPFKCKMPGHKDIPLPGLPAEIPKTKDEIEREIRQILDSNSRLQKLNAFYRFVYSDSHVLLENTSKKHFTFQEAANYADNGPVVSQADEILKTTRETPMILVHHQWRKPYNPVPAFVKSFQSGNGGIFLKNSISWDFKTGINCSKEGSAVYDLKNRMLVRKLDDDIFAMTPDGSHAVGIKGLWHIKSGSLKKELKAHCGFIEKLNCADITPDARYAVCLGTSSTYDHFIYFHDLRRDKIINKKQISPSSGLSLVSMTPDGRIAAVSQGNCVNIWDLDRFIIINSILVHPVSQIRDLVLSLDGSLVSTTFGSEERANTIRIWDTRSGLLKYALEGHWFECYSVDLDSNKAHAVSVAGDYYINVWNLADNNVINKIRLSSAYYNFFINRPFQILAGPDFRYAVTIWESRLDFWDIKNGINPEKRQSHVFQNKGIFLDTGYRMVLSFGRENLEKRNLYFWNMDNGELLDKIPGHYTPFQYSAEKGYALLVHENSLVKIDVQNHKIRSRLPHPDFVQSVDDNVFITGGGNTGFTYGDGKCFLWDLDGEKIIKTIDIPINSPNLHFSADGRILFHSDDVLRIYDLESGSQLHTIINTDNDRLFFGDFILTHDNRYLVYTNGGERLVFIDLADGSKKSMGKGTGVDKEGTHPAYMTPDNRLVLSFSGKSLLIWDIVNERVLNRIKNIPGYFIRISPDGRYAIVTDFDKQSVIDIRKGECISTVHGSFLGSFSPAICSNIDASGFFADCEVTGDIYLFRLMNVPFGDPVVTLKRLWIFSKDGTAGHWDESFSAVCKCCGKSFIVDQKVMDAIKEINETLGTGSGCADCFSLPGKAWENGNLTSQCPECGSMLKFNPFVCDLSLVPDYFNTRASAYMTEYDLEKMRDKAVNEGRDELHYFRKKGNPFYREINRRKARVEQYEKDIEADDGNTDSWEKMGDYLFSIFKFREGCHCYDRLIRLKDTPPEDWYFHKGLKFMGNDEYNPAGYCFNRVLEMDDRNAEAWFYKGYCHQNVDEVKGMWSRSNLDCFDKAIALKPGYKAAIYHEAVSCGTISEYNSGAERLHYLNRLYDIDPGFKDVKEQLTDILTFVYREINEEIPDGTDILEYRKKGSSCWYRRGMEFHDKGNTSKAGRCFDYMFYEMTIAADYAEKARQLLKLGGYDNIAEKYLDKALQSLPENTDLWVNKGIMQLQRNSSLEKALECFDMAIKLEGKNAQAWSHKALALCKSEKYREALNCIDHAIALAPDDINAIFTRGHIHTSMAHYEKALRDFDKVLEKNTGHTGALIGRGLSLYASGGSDAALILFDCTSRALSITPENTEALFLKAKAQCELGQYEESVECYITLLNIIERKEQGSQNKNHVHFSMEAPLSRLLEKYDSILKKNPSDAEALFHKGSILSKYAYTAHRDIERILYYKKAQKFFTQAIASDPDNSEAQNQKNAIVSAIREMIETSGNDKWKAELYLTLGKREKALQKFQSALNEDPYHNFGQARSISLFDKENIRKILSSMKDEDLRKTGDKPAAPGLSCELALICKCLDDKGGAVEHGLHSFNGYFAGKKYNKCLQCLDILFSYDDGFADAQVNPVKFAKNALFCLDRITSRKTENSGLLLRKGRLFEMRRSYDTALSCYDRVLEMDGANEEAKALKTGLAEKYYNKGENLQFKGKYKSALACYEKAIFLNPAHTSSYINKSDVLQHLGLYDKAIECCKECILIDPAESYAYLNIGQNLDKQGRHNDAMSCYKKAMKLKKNDISILNSMGETLANLGRHDEALRQYNKAIALDEHGVHKEVLENKALLLEKIHEYGEAVEYYLKANSFDKARIICQKLLKEKPDDLKIILNMAYVLFMQGKYSRSLYHYNRVLKREPDNTDALLYMGRISEILEKNDQALGFYERLIQTAPGNTEGENSKAGLLFKLKRYKEIIELCDRSVFFVNKTLLQYKAFSYYRLRQYGKAFDAFNALLERSFISINCSETGKNSNDLFYLLTAGDEKIINIQGVILQKLKRYKEALNCFEYIINYNRNNETAKKNKSALLRKINATKIK